MAKTNKFFFETASGSAYEIDNAAMTWRVRERKTYNGPRVVVGSGRLAEPVDRVVLGATLAFWAQDATQPSGKLLHVSAKVTAFHNKKTGA